DHHLAAGSSGHVDAGALSGGVGLDDVLHDLLAVAVRYINAAAKARGDVAADVVIHDRRRSCAHQRDTRAGPVPVVPREQVMDGVGRATAKTRDAAAADSTRASTLVIIGERVSLDPR